VIYLRDKVKDRLVGAHDEANDRPWELRDSMTCDELGDMGHLVSMR
jgi:hypothetical protein